MGPAAPSGTGVRDTADARLIEAFLAGDAQAVAQVRAWLQQASWSYRARLASWEDAQQELMFEVVRLFRRGSFRGEARLKTYLWRVANHTCLNLLRARARERVAAMDDYADRLEDTGSSALEGLLSAEKAEGLARLARAMPADCRRLWDLILRGSSYREMSRRLDVTEEALRVRVHRCRKRAAALWAAWTK